MIAEPGVALTDFVLAVECLVLAVLLLRKDAADRRIRNRFVVFFSALGIAAFAGGLSHGFLHDQYPVPDQIAWSISLLAIGLVGLAGWYIGAWYMERLVLARRLVQATSLLFVLYCFVVVLYNNSFYMAILFYLPATLFLLLLLVTRYVKRNDSSVLPGIAGLLLALFAAGVQQSDLVIHPVWLNQNVLYHLLEFVAILLLYVFASRVSQHRE